MRLLYTSLVAAFACIAACSVAFADEATTYAGTLGKLPIIVELQAVGKDGSFHGRYAYLSKGIDIPLHGKQANGSFVLEEEKPCTEKLCKSSDGQVVETAPIGAEWLLTLSADGTALEGSWKDKDSGKSRPVKLVKKAVRPLSADYSDPDMLDPSYVPVMEEPLGVVTEKDVPYDFLKMQYPLKQGRVVSIGDGAYRMDLDPRSKMDYPVVTELRDGNPAALNRWLAQERLQWSADAFSCLSRAYLGLGWSGSGGEGTTGYEDGGAQVTVDYLTTRLMGLTESGSEYCGGAHPNNFETHRLVDAKTGQPIDTNGLLRGRVAHNADGDVVDPAKVADKSMLTWGPDETLVQFVLDHRDKSGEDPECGMPDLVRTNLGIYVKDGNLIFTLADLPNVVFACTTDLVKMPLKDARSFLTKAGAKYFVELDK